MTHLQKLLTELEALPAKFRRCVLDSSSNWNELVLKAIIEDRLGIDGESELARPNAKAIDFTGGGLRVSCKRVGTPGSIAAINVKHDGLIDEVAIIYQGGGKARYFLVPWAAFKAAATPYGPYANGRATLEVAGARIPVAFAAYEIAVAEAVPLMAEK
jgi:hypothetical protein